MKHGALQFALRRLRRVFSRPGTYGGLAIATAILALSGPFGTIAYLSTPARVGYWGAVAASTYAAGVFASGLVDAKIPAGLVQRTASVLAITCAATLCVLILNAALLGVMPFASAGDSGQILVIFAVALLVGAALESLSAAPSPATAQPPEPPRLLSRLPLDRRGRLVSVSVQDHYVEVVTTNGADLLLMRLSDAIAESDPEPGLQIHRSHWVALAQVAQVRRVGDRAEVTLRDGRILPASRSRLPALREAGLLPR